MRSEAKPLSHAEVIGCNLRDKPIATSPAAEFHAPMMVADKAELSAAAGASVLWPAS
jgi:hypothetical protein